MTSRANRRRSRRATELLENAKANASALAATLRWPKRERFPSLPSDEQVLRELESRQLSFPEEAAPEVSIIVPVYGKFATTWACLESLSTTPAGCSFEVIIVNDCSADRTLEMLSRVRGVRVVSNETNLGFIRSNNHGAKFARGSFLCLLNNDTRVTSGWLAELRSTFDLFPNVGLVGAKLLFPDGSLQEAGGTVFRDGTCSHYGRYRDPARPEYSFARRVDYCSAACALLRRSLWEELGGFDELYLPAYYEDTDLAFRVRRRGQEVVFQPLSRVVHYEGVTHGTNLQQGLKRHQLLNREHFRERWQDVLSVAHPAPESRNWQAANRRIGAGLLVLSDEEPQAFQGAESASCFDALLAADRAGMRVSSWSKSAQTTASSAQLALQRRGVEVLTPPYAPSLSVLLRSSNIARFDALLLWERRDADKVLRAVRRHAPHLKVFTTYMDASAHSLESAEQQASLDAQRAVWAESDGVLTKSRAARDHVLASAPGARAFVLESGGSNTAERARIETFQTMTELIRSSR